MGSLNGSGERHGCTERVERESGGEEESSRDFIYVVLGNLGYTRLWFR